MLNKKTSILLLTIASTLILSSTSYAAERVAQATATWQAKATKDTESSLVVTPLRNLTFNYAQGQNNFNLQDGAFDVTIKGQGGATEFKLTSKIISNTLTSISNNSVLTVGVTWNGKALGNQDIELINTANKLTAGLERLTTADSFNGSDRVSARGNFIFSVTEAQIGSDKVKFNQLDDGVWEGDVNIQFTATWTGKFSATTQPEPVE